MTTATASTGRAGASGRPSAVQASKAFLAPVEAGAAEALRAEKMFACSGSPDSSRYREATKFRSMQGMGWEEARVALNRLVEPVRRDRGQIEPVCRSRRIRPHRERL